jgi:ribosomal protein S18 acetylase RimI-like enzyme
MPASRETIRFTPASEEAVVEALTRAFQDDPATRWMIPDEERREMMNRWLFQNMLKYASKQGVVHTTPDSAGAAIWLPPKKPHMGALDMLRLGMWQMPFRAGFSSIPRFMSVMNSVDKLHKHDPPKRHWYLAVLGVDTDRQGQGIGGELMQPVLKRADSDNLTCYLETAKEINVTFYQKHGFEVVKEFPLGGDGPPFWTMLRQPVR